MPAAAPTDRTSIEVIRNGPYRVRGAVRLRDARGADLTAGGSVALCRCGNSSKKPFCDGTHTKTGFDGTHLTVGPVDNAQAYRGKHITVHDDRMICSHSGVCTDNLSAVFQLGKEPWIDPDGANAEAVIALVQRCPSGALSYTLDGAPDPGASNECQIAVSKNGPYYVSGPVALAGNCAQPGMPERYALCRCGASKNKPYCDGTHWATGFDESRGLQVGAFVLPGGLRRFSLIAGLLVVVGAAAVIMTIEAMGKWSAKGFLFSGALVPDLNLALEIVLLAGLTFGAWLAKRGNIAAHRYNQTIWVLLNTVLVALIMWRGMENAEVGTASDLAQVHILVPWVHAVLGAATVAAGLWLVLQFNGLLPKALHVRRWKTLMRLTLAGYWLVALFGLAIHYLWFMR